MGATIRLYGRTAPFPSYNSSATLVGKGAKVCVLGVVYARGRGDMCECVVTPSQKWVRSRRGLGSYRR